MNESGLDRKFKGLWKAILQLLQLSVLGAAVPIAFGLMVSTFLYFRYKEDIESLQNQYHLEQDSKARSQGQLVQSMFQQVHQGLQTIANFPGVRHMEASEANFRPKESDWGSDAFEGIVQIYQKLSETHGISDIHIIPVEFDSDGVNPTTGEKWGPIATFDKTTTAMWLNLKTGHVVNPAKRAVNQFEVNEMRNQIALFKKGWPTKAQVKLLNYPALMSPIGKTGDDQYAKRSKDPADQQGFVYSVPFYGQDGTLRGIVSCVMLDKVVWSLLASGDTAVVNTKSHLVIRKEVPGTVVPYIESVKMALPDPSLLYSTATPLSITDQVGRWNLWTGKTASDFWKREDVHVLRTTMMLGVGVLWVGIAVLVCVVTTLRKRQDQRLESLLRSSQEILFMTDEQGKIIRVGGQIKKSLGWDAADFVDVNISLFVIETSRQAFREHLERVTSRKYATESCEFEIETLDNDYVWYEMTTSNMSHLPEIGGVLISFRNVETRKHAEFMLRTAKDSAESANEAKSEFLSRMSHELRTPLNAILGFGQLLEMNTSTVKDQESVSHILKAGHHLLNLVNDILDISKIESGNITMSVEPVDCGDVVNTAVSFVRSLAQKNNISIHVDCPVGDCVDADRQRVVQVVVNILTNAIKYNRENGTVTISLSTQGDKTGIVISDTGMGIAPHEIPRLFTPFDRLSADKLPIEGTGLGLALSKTLVDAMGGKILVHSELGEGTTVQVLFKSSKPRLEVVEGSGGTPDRVYGKPIRVLSVEDNEANIQLIEGVFQSQVGFELRTAKQGGIGIELVDTFQPHIVLLDLHLADMSGMEVLEYIRKHTDSERTRIIVLSAEGSPAQLEIALMKGADHLLSKPIDIKNLLTLIHEIAEAA